MRNGLFLLYQFIGGLFIWAVCVSFLPPEPIPEGADTWMQAGRVHWAEGRYDSAYHAYRRAQALVENDPETYTTAQYNAARALSRMARFEEAIGSLDSVIHMYGVIDSTFPAVILARRERIAVDFYQGNWEHVFADMHELIRACEALPPNGDSLLAMVYHSTANFYTLVEGNDTARLYTQKALDIRRRIFHPDHITIAYSENTLGLIRSNQDRYLEALEHFKETDRILSLYLPDEHPQRSKIRGNIGIQYSGLGQFWKAAEVHKLNLNHLDQLPPQEQFNNLVNYASMLKVIGDYTAVLDYFQRAELILTDNPGLSPEREAYIYSEKSSIYLDQNSLNKALTANQKAIDLYESVYGNRSNLMVDRYIRRGLIFSEMNEHDQAIIFLKKAVSLAEENPSTGIQNLAYAIEYLGEVMSLTGRYEDAIQQYRRAAAMYQTSDLDWNLPDPYRKMGECWQRLG
ncbi:MAG: tetratricopeptide repeat protein, partial [Bacteroidota bacterium]